MVLRRGGRARVPTNGSGQTSAPKRSTTVDSTTMPGPTSAAAPRRSPLPAERDRAGPVRTVQVLGLVPGSPRRTLVEASVSGRATTSVRRRSDADGARPWSQVATTWSLIRRSASRCSSGSSTRRARAADHDAAVVHRVVERGARQHESVDLGDRRAELDVDRGPQQPVRRRAVQVQQVVGPPEGHRQHERAVVGHHADVRDQRVVEDRPDGGTVVVATSRASAQSDSFARCGGWILVHGRESVRRRVRSATQFRVRRSDLVAGSS